jgi:hypothetical protein
LIGVVIRQERRIGNSLKTVRINDIYDIRALVIPLDVACGVLTEEQISTSDDSRVVGDLNGDDVVTSWSICRNLKVELFGFALCDSIENGYRWGCVSKGRENTEVKKENEKEKSALHYFLLPLLELLVTGTVF